MYTYVIFQCFNGDRLEAINVGIIITDGYPTREIPQTIPEVCVAMMLVSFAFYMHHF